MEVGESINYSDEIQKLKDFGDLKYDTVNCLKSIWFNIKRCFIDSLRIVNRILYYIMMKGLKPIHERQEVIC